MSLLQQLLWGEESLLISSFVARHLPHIHHPISLPYALFLVDSSPIHSLSPVETSTGHMNEIDTDEGDMNEGDMYHPSDDPPPSASSDVPEPIADPKRSIYAQKSVEPTAVATSSPHNPDLRLDNALLPATPVLPTTSCVATSQAFTPSSHDFVDLFVSPLDDADLFLLLNEPEYLQLGDIPTSPTAEPPVLNLTDSQNSPADHNETPPSPKPIRRHANTPSKRRSRPPIRIAPRAAPATPLDPPKSTEVSPSNEPTPTNSSAPPASKNMPSNAIEPTQPSFPLASFPQKHQQQQQLLVVPMVHMAPSMYSVQFERVGQDIASQKNLVGEKAIQDSAPPPKKIRLKDQSIRTNVPQHPPSHNLQSEPQVQPFPSQIHSQQQLHPSMLSPGVQIVQPGIASYEQGMLPVFHFAQYPNPTAAAALEYQHGSMGAVPQPALPVALDMHSPFTSHTAQRRGIEALERPQSTSLDPSSHHMPNPHIIPQPAIINKPVVVTGKGTHHSIPRQPPAKLGRHPMLGKLQLENGPRAKTDVTKNTKKFDKDGEVSTAFSNDKVPSCFHDTKGNGKAGSTLKGIAKAAGDKERRGQKKRLVWTQELHDRFVKAIDAVGLAQAVPKTLITIMNVEGLTTEHVKSHLQKYRNSLKRENAMERNNASFNAPRQNLAGVVVRRNGIDMIAVQPRVERVESVHVTRNSGEVNDRSAQHVYLVPNRTQASADVAQAEVSNDLLSVDYGKSKSSIGLPDVKDDAVMEKESSRSCKPSVGSNAKKTLVESDSSPNEREKEEEEKRREKEDSRQQRCLNDSVENVQVDGTSEKDGIASSSRIMGNNRTENVGFVEDVESCSKQVSKKRSCEKQDGHDGAAKIVLVNSKRGLEDEHKVDAAEYSGGVERSSVGEFTRNLKMGTWTGEGRAAEGASPKCVGSLARDLELELMKEKTLEMQLQMQMMAHRTIAMQKEVERISSVMMQAEVVGGVYAAQQMGRSCGRNTGMANREGQLRNATKKCTCDDSSNGEDAGADASCGRSSGRVPEETNEGRGEKKLDKVCTERKAELEELLSDQMRLQKGSKELEALIAGQIRSSEEQIIAKEAVHDG